MKITRFVAALLMLALTTPAWAEDIGEGLMNSVAFYPLPAGSQIHVRTLDDSERNLQMVQEFKKILQQKGYRLDDQANYILSFTVYDGISIQSGAEDRALLRGEGSNLANDNTRVVLNVYDSNSGGAMNLGRGRVETITPGQYRMDVQIDNRTNGKRVWQGWTTGAMTSSDEVTLTKAMVPALVKGLGKTVKNQTFRLETR